MSLLDDVSIVVTPNGYKAGTLFGVIPVPTVGTEEVVNGDFATDTDWTKGTGWTISGGTANANTSGSYINFYQNNVFTIGKAYQYEFTILNYSQGEVRFTQGGVDISGVKNANGTYTGVFSASQTSLYFQGVSSFIGSIDNVSVKEWTGADMDVTRATAATRVDEAGLVNYAEVVSDTELVSNGDFEIASGDVGGFWTTGAGWAILGNGLATRAATGTNFAVDRDSFLTINQTYKVVIVVQVVTSGNVKVVLGATNSPEFTAAGTYTFIGVQTNNTKLRISPSNDYVGSVSNISVKEVTRDNVPRIDYTGGGCPHILAEPQRTNLITYSSDFSSGWTGAATLNSNSSISPDGTLNASNLLRVSSSSERKDFNVTVLANTEYVYSFYIKEGSQNNGDSRMAISTSVEQILYLTPTSDWVRYELLIPSTNTNTSVIVRIYPSNGAAGGVDGDNINIYGAQLEQGSYATSYIPTSGSTVTRNQDQFTRDGIGSLINSTEGVLFLEMAALSDDLTRRKITISDGTLSNFCSLYFDSVSNRIIGRTTVGGVLQSFLITSSYTEINFNKIAFKWKENDFSLWVNGTEVAVDTSGVVWSSGVLTKISFDNGVGAENLFGKVKQLQVFKTALTDSELATLTTI